MTAPALFENFVATGETYDDLPRPEQPYFVIAEEGTFMHRNTALGRVLVPSKPKRMGKTGFKQGAFYWDAPVIPGTIIAQATDFFRRIYAKHKTEAEVLITYHEEQKRFRLFVPVQRVSHSGVKSIYEPSHIQKDWLVVGTLHSHCNFSAFHSGTDSADASDMDGVHFTIGMLERETPEIVAMVAMNGKEFHYKEPAQIAEIVFTGTTAPEWWDEFVYPGQTPTDKPKGFKTVGDGDWNEFKGLHVGVKRPTTVVTNGIRHWPNNMSVYGSNAYNDYGDWYENQLQKQGTIKGSEDRKNGLIVWREHPKTKRYSPYDLTHGNWVDEDMTEEEQLLDFVIDSGIDNSIIPTGDITTLAAMNRKDIQKYLLQKMSDTADLLEMLYIDVQFTMQVLPETVVPATQTTMFEENTNG